ncbi:hypothetical protein POVCU2_0002540 [Plasmodium ovale curtisi]|uniref:Uncharacterized protein n=1 Tax=Plasmodium ovale curtisi TaxID=864141 RepID=A0A1A8VJK0_PLAOA|nr:hypothetical protein POVCU2_0002540 [Plasmodium ovale curtisi]SBS80689.1 hypothetical protein POVCU1_002320 [Plasmodium ovale curtisi]
MHFNSLKRVETRKMEACTLEDKSKREMHRVNVSVRQQLMVIGDQQLPNSLLDAALLRPCCIFTWMMSEGLNFSLTKDSIDRSKNETYVFFYFVKN